MGKRKLKVKASIRVDAYEFICRAVEQGVAYGWNRANKHTAKPSEEEMKAAMYGAVINELCEILKFD